MARMIVLARELRYPRGRDAKTYKRGETFEPLPGDEGRGIKALRLIKKIDFAPPGAPLGHVASTTIPAGSYSHVDIVASGPVGEGAAADGPKPRGGYRTRRLKAGDTGQD